MAPYYNYICNQCKNSPYFNGGHEYNKLDIVFDQKLYDELSKKNEATLTDLENKINESKEKEGELDVTLNLIKKAEYLAKIGSKVLFFNYFLKDESILVFRQVYERDISLGAKFDTLFTMIRIGFLFWDIDLIRRNIEKAKL